MAFEHPAWWVGFGIFVLAMLALDLGVFHRKAHAVSFREAIGWSVVWIALAGAFGALVWWVAGPETSLEFVTAYALEKALSVDNLFIILLTLDAFRVPEQARHRVLFWGVLGALAMRTVFIIIGAALLARFHWLLYVFGAFLVVAAVRLLFGGSEPSDGKESWLMARIRRVLPMRPSPEGVAFVVKEGGKLYATPLLLALIAVEVSDLVFALDSIPAVFAVTQKPFIVLSSNVFAVLGLRSLFFALAGLLHRFHLLKYGLAAVLAFIGLKLLLAGVIHVPVIISLLVVMLTLALTMAASLLWPQRAPKASLASSATPPSAGSPVD